MDKIVENLADRAEKLEGMANRTDIALTEMRLQFETMMQMQMEERDAIDKRYKEETASIRKHYGRIIAGLILTLCMIIGSVVGAVIYLFSNYDFAVATYQDVISGENGVSNIYDGIHITEN